MVDLAIKPIETVYNGYRFRSRLEARWAVFFDALGVRYEYEKEGFELGDGLRYLPDFWLPDVGVWVEVKGQEPTDEERHKAGLLAAKTGDWVDIFWPEPWEGVNVYGFRSRLPEHMCPEVRDYVDLALSCGHYWVARTLVTATEFAYWQDVWERLAQEKGWRKVLPAREQPYLELLKKDLRACPNCAGLVFGDKPQWRTRSIWQAVKVDPQQHTLEFVSRTQEYTQVLEIEVPEWEDDGYPGFCQQPRCSANLEADTAGDRKHPRLLAAFQAARSARFEFGERGAPHVPHD